MTVHVYRACRTLFSMLISDIVNSAVQRRASKQTSLKEVGLPQAIVGYIDPIIRGYEVTVATSVLEL